MPGTVNTRHPEVARLFAAEAARHTMLIRHDSGVYRHLVFRHPDTNLYWFDLVTFPGALVFTGDYGTWVFRRLNDMLDFFDGVGDINPGYWAEKVVAGETHAYDPDLAHQHVTEAFDEWAYGQGLPTMIVSRTWGTLLNTVLDEETICSEDTFRAAVRDLEFSDGPFFSDTWEWDLRGFKSQFLWACFAVRHGVNRYRAYQTEQAQPDAVVVYPTPAKPPVPRKTEPRPDGTAARFDHVSARSGLTVQPREEYL